jgi:hypothetical protein
MAGEEPWVRVRLVVRECYKRIDESLTELTLAEPPNIIFLALAGWAGAVNARAERICDTILGDYAPDFFKPFFTAVRPAPDPFDFTGLLRGEEYTVKVVSGKRAFNSKTRKAVEEASLEARRPVVLTVQGDFFPTRKLGEAAWYSAPASWKMVAGNGAYRVFRDIVFGEAQQFRDSIIAKILAARERARQRTQGRR